MHFVIFKLRCPDRLRPLLRPQRREPPVLGGAIGAGAFTVGFATGFSSTAIGMGLQNVLEDTSYSTGEILLYSLSSGLINGALSKGIDFIRIPGLNSGKNSFAAITKSSITKKLNGTISAISRKTVAKILAYNTFGSMGGTLWSGFASATDFYPTMQRWWLLGLDEGWI